MRFCGGKAAIAGSCSLQVIINLYIWLLRKLAAILSLALLVFNLAGYRLWFYYAERQSDAAMEAKLETKSYNENELITISVPLNLPYQTDWVEFERVDGEIVVDGATYKYVERKIAHGELILKCLSDSNKTQLKSAREEFFKLANDLQNAPAKKSGSNTSLAFKNLVLQYDAVPNAWTASLPCHLVKTGFAPYQTATTEIILSSIDQPPELLVV